MQAGTESRWSSGDEVEIQGSSIFGKGYEGSWHSGTILVESTSSREIHQRRYDVELVERVPHSTAPQVARKILADHMRPRPSSAALAWSDLRPGLLVEQRLPEVQTCWWLAIVVSVQEGKAMLAYPTSARGQSCPADPTHSFRATSHWDPASFSWVSTWMGPFADHFQDCMYYHFSKMHPRKKAAEKRDIMPDVHEAVAACAGTASLYTCTDIGPGTPRVQGTLTTAGAAASGARTPRSSACLRVQNSPARTPRRKAGKAGGPAGRLAATQRAGGRNGSAPNTPRKSKTGAKHQKAAAHQPVAGEAGQSGAPASALTWVPPGQMPTACDSLRPGTPRRSKLTDADVEMNVKLLVGNAASARAPKPATASKVPLLPIGRASPGKSMVDLSPRVLEHGLQAENGVQVVGAVSAAETWQSNDLLAGCSQEDAALFRKRALDAACKGEQISAPAGGSWDLGDLGDVAGDWAPTVGSMNISFVKARGALRAQQELQNAALQLLSLRSAR